MGNPEVQMTLDDCVDEVLGMLTGLELRYMPELDRYRSITRQINRALRATALEREWSYYTDLEDVGLTAAGVQDVAIRASVRPRIIGDDSVRLCRDDGYPVVWAYFLPRDAIEKYPARTGLWVSSTRSSLHFSRPFTEYEAGLHIQLPVMREPKMFRLPEQPEGDEGPLVDVPDTIRNQLLDFEFPDAVLSRAAYFYAQTDPVMQPRVQTLEQEYKTVFYALNERDDRNTDSPYLNEYTVPIQSDIFASSNWDLHHPHSDERR
jgi:hypothetical protein